MTDAELAEYERKQNEELLKWDQWAKENNHLAPFWAFDSGKWLGADYCDYWYKRRALRQLATGEAKLVRYPA